MMADAYLPITVTDIPCYWVFQPDGHLRDRIRSLPTGVVRVIAGAEKCHVVIDIKRPYFRPVSMGAAND
jgi:hypothetical protein